MTMPEPATARALPGGRRSRDPGAFVFWYLGVSSIVLVALLVIVAVQVTGNSANVARLQRLTVAQQQGVIAQCRLNNITRMQDIAIWDRLLYVPPTAARTETRAQRDEIAELLRLVTVKDTPRDCSKA